MTNQVFAALLAPIIASSAAASPEPSIPLRELYAEARIGAVVEVLESSSRCWWKFVWRSIQGPSD